MTSVAEVGKETVVKDNFSNCATQISEWISEEKKTVWRLNSWYPATIFRSQVSCTLTFGSNDLDSASLRFYFRETTGKFYTIETNEYGREMIRESSDSRHEDQRPTSQYCLFVEPHWNLASRKSLSVELRVSELSESLDVSGIQWKEKSFTFNSPGKEQLLIPMIIVQYKKLPSNSAPLPENPLIYGIRAKVFGCRTTLRLIHSIPVESGLEPLVQNLKTLLASEKNYTDCVLEAKDGILIGAHKFILAARSEKFKALLEEAEEEEGFDGVLKIKDMDGKLLMHLLTWMYTGQLDGSMKVLPELLKVAISHDLPDLLRLLEYHIVRICWKGNMFELYNLADKHGLPKAKEYIRAFIKESF